MKNILIYISVLTLTLFSLIRLSSCDGKSVSFSVDDIKKSIENDFSISVANYYTKSDHSNWGYEEILERYNLSLERVRHNSGRYHLLYFNRNDGDKQIAIYISNARNSYKQAKDVIRILDYPFRYQYDDFYNKMQLIDDKELVEKIESETENMDFLYFNTTPFENKIFRDFVFSFGKYYLFITTENDAEQLYVYDTSTRQTIYPSSFDGDLFQHLIDVNYKFWN